MAKIAEAPKIIIQNLFNREVRISNGGQNTVFELLQRERIDWMHACGTKGRCTTCKFEVLLGSDSITAKNKVELRYENLGLLKENERLACQCMPTGSIVIRVPNSSKMPHMKYSD